MKDACLHIIDCLQLNVSYHHRPRFPQNYGYKGLVLAVLFDYKIEIGKLNQVIRA